MVKSSQAVDPGLLDLLVCPVSRMPLKYDKENQELISEEANLAYPIRDGIPILLPEEAQKIEKDSYTSHL